jgi:steroid delta-isomerase-like uncharacterized protein
MGFDFNGYVGAFDRHDPSAFGSYFADEGTYDDLTLGKHWEGPEGIAGFVRESESEFSSDYRFELRSATETSGGYFVEWTLKGTHDRTSRQPPLPATGRPYEILGVSVGELEDGKIKANRDYWNALSFLTQVGILPGPPQAQPS